jgi:hypothetical protein
VDPGQVSDTAVAHLSEEGQTEVETLEQFGDPDDDAVLTAESPVREVKEPKANDTDEPEKLRKSLRPILEKRSKVESDNTGDESDEGTDIPEQLAALGQDTTELERPTNADELEKVPVSPQSIKSLRIRDTEQDDDSLQSDEDNERSEEDTEDSRDTTKATSTVSPTVWRQPDPRLRSVRRQPQLNVQGTTTTTQTPLRQRAPLPTVSPVAQVGNLAREADDDDQSLAEDVGRLTKEQRKWAGNVLMALGLPSTSSQARVLGGAVAASRRIKDKGSERVKKLAGPLLKTVLDAGRPPWKDAAVAMAATGAKVQLDLLSIPKANRKLVPLKADSGENQAFWIEQTDAIGNRDKSFLCKPRNFGNDSETQASGGPKGGEVAREALAGRAAHFLASINLDIGMPETHVVKLDSEYVPGQSEKDPPVTCSVQEFRPSQGSVKGVGSDVLDQLDGDQIACLSIADTIMLNTDRHAGNLLLNGNDIVPIDHGESFAEPNEVGLARIRVALGGAHNALLGIPKAHEPMSTGVSSKVSTLLDAGQLSTSLKKDRDTTAAVHGDMKGMISDDAIEVSRRSAAFVKLAAGAKLSPAAIQVALGSGANELLDVHHVDELTFTKRASSIIKKAAEMQSVIKDVCLASGSEYAALCNEVKNLGWEVQDRGAPPNPSHFMLCDPMMMLSAIKNQTPPRKRGPAPKGAGANPKEADKQAAAGRKAEYDAKEAEGQANFNKIQRESISLDDARQIIMVIRKTTIDTLLKFIPAKEQQRMNQEQLRIAALPKDEQYDECGELSRQLNEMAFDFQKDKFDQLAKTYQWESIYEFTPPFERGMVHEYPNAKRALGGADVLGAMGSLNALEQGWADGTLAKKVVSEFGLYADDYAKQGQLPASDPDVKGLRNAPDAATARQYEQKLSAKIKAKNTQ